MPLVRPRGGDKFKPQLGNEKCISPEIVPFLCHMAFPHVHQASFAPAALLCGGPGGGVVENESAV